MIDADGTRDGYDLELLRAIAGAVSVPVIASGGAGTLEHLLQAVTVGGADAALAASIFHFGTYTVAEAKRFMAAHGVPMRIVEPVPRATDGPDSATVPNPKSEIQNPKSDRA